MIKLNTSTFQTLEVKNTNDTQYCIACSEINRTNIQITKG